MPALLPLYETFNPDTYGGAMLLGVDGVCVISHGSTRRPPCATPSGSPQRWSRQTWSGILAPRSLRLGKIAPVQLGHPPEREQSSDRAIGGVVPAETHVGQGPLDRAAILDLVRIAWPTSSRSSRRASTRVIPSATTSKPTRSRSIELVEAIEEELCERTVGFRIDDEDLEDLKTVRDAVDYVVARIG